MIDIVTFARNVFIINYKDSTFQKYLNNKYNIGKFNIEELLEEDYLVYYIQGSQT
ncbi:MAG: hypothetical protein N2448_06535 [Caloramator sp.]|nr:hypothetical protein [Caloramator sp.]